MWVRSKIISVNSYVWSPWGKREAVCQILFCCSGVILTSRSCAILIRFPHLAIYTHTTHSLLILYLLFFGSCFLSYFSHNVIIAVIIDSVTKAFPLCNITNRTKKDIFLALLPFLDALLYFIC